VGQAVWNLVDNALKYAPGGGRVAVCVAREGGEVVVAVEDSGPGFQDPSQAFTRFFREDAARTHGTATDGTGLGLAIVRAVAEAHGGSASAENRRGGGARVVVRLPAGAAEVTPAAPARPVVPAVPSE
jgi:signal transduction histidine kinase